jgi:hypothetical protein
MDKEKTELSDLRGAIYGLADDLNGLVSREHQILKDELGQVSMLVGDAIKTLVESFNSLNEQVTEQTELIQSIVAKVSDSQVSDSGNQKSEQLARISELNQQINLNVATATRSLQFDDIVQQLVIHSHGRVEQMDHLFVGLYEKLSELKIAEIHNSRQTSKYIAAMQEEISRIRITLEKSNPVKQTSMGAGKAELF